MNGNARAGADLWIPAPRAAGMDDRRRILRSTRRVSIREICEVAGIRYRVTGGRHPQAVQWSGPGHAYTTDDTGQRVYAIDRTGLPQAAQMRALRMLEILAYGFHDYAARESVVGRRYFVYPLAPEHGRAWLAEIGRRGGQARTTRKKRSSRRNGRKAGRASPWHKVH